MDHAAQGRVLRDRGEKRMRWIKASLASSQNARQIVAETVDAGSDGACAQRFEGEPQNLRPLQRQYVAAAGLVFVDRRIPRLETVEADVIEAAQGEGRAKRIALAGMVQDYVEDDGDAGGLQRLDGVAHLRPAAGSKPWVGSKHGDRIIAPVIGQPQLRADGAHRSMRRSAEARRR